MRVAALLPVLALAALAAGCSDPFDDVDFVVDAGPTAVPADPVENTSFTVQFVARNGGRDDARDVLWRLYRDGTRFASDRIDLDGRSSRTISVLVPGGDVAGTHQWRVKLDPDDEFAERHEGNNSATADIVVAPSGGG